MSKYIVFRRIHRVRYFETKAGHTLQPIKSLRKMSIPLELERANHANRNLLGLPKHRDISVRELDVSVYLSFLYLVFVFPLSLYYIFLSILTSRMIV